MTDTTLQEQAEIDKAAKQLSELEELKAKIEERKKKNEQEKKALKQEEARLNRETEEAKRAFDTKGKILFSAAIINECKHNYATFENVKKMLASYLTRDIDRAAVQPWIAEIEAEHVRNGTKPQQQSEQQPVQEMQQNEPDQHDDQLSN